MRRPLVTIQQRDGPSKMRKRNRAGFSLMELLVVIAIIGVLAALLLLALSKSKSQAQRIQCVNNIHQLGLTLQQFVGDNQVYPLGVNPQYLKDGYPEHQTNWETALQGILNRADPVHYPAGADPFTSGVWLCSVAPRPSNIPEGQGYSSYGYNAYGLNTQSDSLGLGGHYVWHEGPAKSMSPPVKDSEVVNPSGMMAIGDSFEGGNGVIVDGGNFFWRTSNLQDRGESTARSYARHHGKANVVFCDGHVESPTLKFLFEDTSDAALVRWNRDHLPHRERLEP